MRIKKHNLGTLLVLFFTLNLFLGVLLLDRGIILQGIPMSSVRSVSLPVCVEEVQQQQQQQPQQQQSSPQHVQLPIKSSFNIAHTLALAATAEMNLHLPSAYKIDTADLQVLEFSENLLAQVLHDGRETQDTATTTAATQVDLLLRGSLKGDATLQTEIPIKLLIDNTATTATTTTPNTGKTPNFLLLDPPLHNLNNNDYNNKELVSIIYVTNRPGSFDFLFHSLAQQTDSRYELIVVDELAPYRSEGVTKMAEELRIPLKVHIPGKPKTRNHRYGITNGINTGLFFADGAAVAVVMDFAWLPPRFVERIFRFYETHPAESLLGFPEIKMSVPEDIMDENKGSDKSAISIFKHDMVESPLKSGWDVSLGPFPKEFKRNESDAFLPQEGYWELYCAAFPRMLVAQHLNGIDEELDRGHDMHETWLRLRAESMGYKVYLDHGSLIQTVDHYHFGKGRKLATRMVNGVPHIGVDEKGEERQPTMWWRGAMEDNSNYKRFPILMDKFEAGILPLKAQNDFDMNITAQIAVLRRVLKGIDYISRPSITTTPTTTTTAITYPVTLQSALIHHRYAYATLVLTPDYVVGAIGLALSLRADAVNTRKDIDIIVLIGCELTQVQRAALDVVFSRMVDVKPIKNPMKDRNLSSKLDFYSEHEKKFWQDHFPLDVMDLVYTKLHLWALTEYKKVVFFDADTMILKNVDELFDRPELSAAPDILPPDSFNSGVMVLEPSEKRYCDLLQKMYEIPSYEGTDQGFLNNYFTGWYQSDERRLPNIYNTMTNAKAIYFPSFYRHQKRIRVLHFTPKKPWKDLPPCQDQMIKEEHTLWWKMLYQQFHSGPENEKHILYAFFVNNLPQQGVTYLTGTPL